MKKFSIIALALAIMLIFVGCANETKTPDNAATGDVKSEGVMTYDEYIAAALDAEVTIEAYVQATQGWWFDNDAGYGKITVYAQDYDGAYFIYEMKCEEADAAKLVPGTKIKVTGYKGEWAGEVEIMDPTFEFAGDATYIAEPIDATSLLGTDDLIKHQNEFGVFKGMTVEAVAYKNEGAVINCSYQGEQQDLKNVYSNIGIIIE